MGASIKRKIDHTHTREKDKKTPRCRSRGRAREAFVIPRSHACARMYTHGLFIPCLFYFFSPHPRSLSHSILRPFFHSLALFARCSVSLTVCSRIYIPSQVCANASTLAFYSRITLFFCIFSAFLVLPLLSALFLSTSSFFAVCLSPTFLFHQVQSQKLKY